MPRERRRLQPGKGPNRHPITSSSTSYLLEAVEGGVLIVDVVLVHLVRQHEQVLRLGEPYHSLDIGAGQDLARGDVRVQLTRDKTRANYCAN